MCFSIISILLKRCLFTLTHHSRYRIIPSVEKERKCQKEFINLKSSIGYDCMVFGLAEALKVEDWY